MGTDLQPLACCPPPALRSIPPLPLPAPTLLTASSAEAPKRSPPASPGSPHTPSRSRLCVWGEAPGPLALKTPQVTLLRD